jgi:hypothetical protein
MPDPPVADEPSGFVFSLDQPVAPSTGTVTSLPGYNPNAKPGAPGAVAVKPTAAAAATPTSAAAASAGSSVWDAISSVFGSVGKIAPSIIQSKAAQAVINATNKIAGRPVVGAGVVSPWYLNPFVLGAGLLVVGGGTYIAMKSRPGSRGRRRR